LKEGEGGGACACCTLGGGRKKKGGGGELLRQVGKTRRGEKGENVHGSRGRGWGRKGTGPFMSAAFPKRKGKKKGTWK